MLQLDEMSSCSTRESALFREAMSRHLVGYSHITKGLFQVWNVATVELTYSFSAAITFKKIYALTLSI